MNGINPRLTTGELLAIFILSLLFLMGCVAGQQPTLSPQPTSPSPIMPSAAPADVSQSNISAQPDWMLVPARPFDEALMDAAHSLLSLVELPPPGEKRLLLIDAPIDGNSGIQSFATRKIESRLGDLVRKKYPQFSLQPFTPEHVSKSPLVLIGTLTPVNGSGLAEGRREAYRICLALTDLKSASVVSKEMTRAQMQGVNHTPTPYFQESPAWMHERSAEGYIQTCETSKPGDRVGPAYLDGVMTRARLSEAMAAYDSGNYKQALERYSRAAETLAGEELRVHNGLYLTNLKLGRSAAAAAALAKIVEYGLTRKQLAMNFLFKPGAAVFAAVQSANGNYATWVNEIARHAAQSNDCLEIIGHTSRSGPESLNERLSLQRAEYVRKQLEAEATELAGRIIAHGVGSRENLVGTGKDDMSDALDRRVAFQVISCAHFETQTAHR